MRLDIWTVWRITTASIWAFVTFLITGGVISVILALAVVDSDLAGVGALLFAGAVGVLVGTRKFRQSAPGDGEPRCASCGYCLRGNVSGRCPECGALIESSDEH